MELPYANLKISHQNPGAELPLIIPIHLICNTSDEQIYSNIRTNSKTTKDWVKPVDEHDGVALLCGSGPSLKDSLDDIRWMKASGGIVFAMNGAAKFLNDNGILPDYQIMIDARQETSMLVGPAKEHLFASQVHPDCFMIRPTARLWHLQVGNIEDNFPDYEGAYALIGGAASVGNTATCLAYVLGFRNLHCYGYDSSCKGEVSHAFRQPMNDGEPMAHVALNGKAYLSSLTMKLQAEKFMDTAEALKLLGVRLEVHGYGLLPDLYNMEKMEEKAKYVMAWNQKEYRVVAPGEIYAEQFVSVANPEEGTRIVDYGCGTGRGTVQLWKLTKCELVQVDFAPNCRDEGQDFTFIEADLTEKIPVFGDYGYCTDVMEHIPPDDVEKVIRNIMASSRKTFFAISTIDDVAGGFIGQRLHMTVMPHENWKRLLLKMGYKIVWEKAYQTLSMFYIKEEDQNVSR